MSYSFTDAEDDCLTRRTMMVPFVDLLNHSSHHHAELTFHRKALRLMAVRHIKKVELQYKVDVLYYVKWYIHVLWFYLVVCCTIDHILLSYRGNTFVILGG